MDFLAWAESIGDRLRNPVEILRWNSHKRYLDELARAGLDVVPTTYVDPADPTPELTGEIVVKPAVSAGARDTGRFSDDRHRDAEALLARLAAEGREAMVQPYLRSVDTEGETAVVFCGGEPTHVLRKRAVLRPDEEAPLRRDDLGAAEAMYDPELVTGSRADGAEQDLAAAVFDYVRRRFGSRPPYARVDMVPGPDGAPAVMELELVEPYLYLATAPAAVDRLAEAILHEASAAASGP